ncbi:glycosyltransferase family 32 protein [Fomitiporia mediterranea MF3/22]|uniref:Glycosyltransferase family 32 protein n=1 Tax=Fomitiporia mediterranea (strain MF3/22) TaxID=694068 RepID=R7SHE9_FOMME|nr:glycosyltransferase family 32 protein [Fomitiporia mediterranea MF3/22]EJC97707.1 glycosyltransferase family 32 protein [Fomitiporia mediterranea MF3/22]
MKYSSFWRPRSVLHFCRLVLFLGLAILFVVVCCWEPHVEITFYPRSWIAREVLPIEPLAGCFDPMRVSPRYNLSQLHAPKRYEVQAGMPMQLGLDCYDFAGTLQPQPRRPPLPGESPPERVNFHTYWRTDLVPFGERQEWMVKSFFATQDLAHARLILWSNGDLRSNEMVRRWTRKYPDAFQLRIVDVENLAKGTALEGSDLLYAKDSKAWVDGDLVRLLVTWAYGGVWIDMDSLLTRDLSPLLEHEFVTQWDCYDKIYQPMNGAVMHFKQHSPYLCEAFEIMARSPPPKSGTTEWGSLLYFKLWRRLIASSIPPFKILPFCFTDGRSCRLDNRLPDPFAKDRATWAGMRGLHEGGPLDQALGKIFSVHLHNQWHKSFPRGGWVERLLLKRYDRALGIEGSPLHHLHQAGEKPFILLEKDDD